MVTDRMTPLQVEGRTIHQIGMPYHWGANGYAKGDSMNELSSMSLDPSSHIQEVKALSVDIRPGRRPRGAGAPAARARLPRARRDHRADGDGQRVQRTAALLNVLLEGGGDPAGSSGYAEHPPRMGFFTDTSLCIGCKACEVACKEWNQVPEDGLNWTGHSHDNTGGLGADTWRHVAFIEQRVQIGEHEPNFQRAPAAGGRGEGRLSLADVLRRVQALHARRLPGRLPDRRDLPHRVRHRRRAAGHLQRLRLLRAGVPVRRARQARGRRARSSSARSATTASASARSRPARRPARPTRSSSARWTSCASAPAGASSSCTRPASCEARLYGESPDDGVGGDGAFFLLLDEPEVYGLPPDPIVTTRDLPRMWRNVGLAAGALLAGAAASFAGARR